MCLPFVPPHLVPAADRRPRRRYVVTFSEIAPQIGERVRDERGGRPRGDGGDARDGRLSSPFLRLFSPPSSLQRMLRIICAQPKLT